MLHSLQRSKEIAKNFKADEDKRKRTTQNIKLVCSLIDIKTKPRMLTDGECKKTISSQGSPKLPRKKEDCKLLKCTMLTRNWLRA